MSAQLPLKRPGDNLPVKRMEPTMKPIVTALVALIALCGTAIAQTATPLVSVEWAAANIGKPGVVFLDVRGRLAGASKDDYLRGHIPGAIWTNYLKDDRPAFQCRNTGNNDRQSRDRERGPCRHRSGREIGARYGNGNTHLLDIQGRRS